MTVSSVFPSNHRSANVRSAPSDTLAISQLDALIARSYRFAPKFAHYAGHVVRAPFWAAQLLTGAKSFRDNPILGSPLLNRLGLHVARQDLAHRLATIRRRRMARLVSPVHADAFARDGFVLVRDFLPPAEFEALRREAADRRGTARETVQGDTITRRVALDPPALRQMPAVARLLRHPVARGIIRYVGGHDAEPVHYLQSILSGVVPGPPDPQTVLHADTFQPTVKAWLTLTPVAEDEGPFVYVPGSHRLTPARRAWERRMSIGAGTSADRLTGRGSFRIGVEELAALGYGPPRRFAVPANTLIAADTSGFHARGLSARPALRVEVWSYGRRSPFLSPPLDPWRIPALASRRAPLFWRMGDMLARMGIKPQVWQARRDMSAFDPPPPSPSRAAPGAGPEGSGRPALKEIFS